jgi:hypothetical protein
MSYFIEKKDKACVLFALFCWPGSDWTLRVLCLEKWTFFCQKKFFFYFVLRLNYKIIKLHGVRSWILPPRRKGAQRTGFLTSLFLKPENGNVIQFPKRCNFLFCNSDNEQSRKEQYYTLQRPIVTNLQISTRIFELHFLMDVRKSYLLVSLMMAASSGSANLWNGSTHLACWVAACSCKGTLACRGRLTLVWVTLLMHSLPTDSHL